MGDDLVDARHLLGFGEVNPLDNPVGDFGLDQCQAGCIGRHLQGNIRAVIPGPGHLGQGRRPGIAGPDDLVVSRLEEEVFFLHFTPHDLGGIHDGVDQGLIAGAAADVPVDLEPAPDLLPAGVGVFFQ